MRLYKKGPKVRAAAKAATIFVFNFNPSQPRVPAGSSAGGQFGSGVGSAFASMAEDKKWIKNNQARYDSDPEFRAVADAATIFTQGGYGAFQIQAALAVGAPIPEHILPKHLHEEFGPKMVEQGTKPLSTAASPMNTWKNFFEGQNVAAADHTTLAEASKSMMNAIASSPPTTTPIYRGISGKGATSIFPGHGAQVPTVGTTLSLTGPTSFSRSATLAEQFATNTSSATKKHKGLSPGAYAVVYKVNSGAKGIHVEKLSPWKNQEEVISAGQFKVLGVTKRISSYKGEDYDLFEVELVHTSTYEVR